MADSKRTNRSEIRMGVSNAFELHRSALRAFVAGFVRQAADIDDVTQEAFMRAFNAEKAKEIEQPRAFLFTIAKNLVLSEFTKKSNQLTDYIADLDATEVELIDEANNVEGEVHAQEVLSAYCKAAAALPEQCRRVFLLRKVYGLPHKEIAARLGISVSTVEKHLVKGVKQCSDYLRARL